jgi:hypothetical protein
MTQRHKHADLIIAWTNGAQIQVYDPSTEEGWCSIRLPLWQERNEYRIKPEPKPDTVKYGYLCLTTKATHWEMNCHEDNIRATFDGETGALKSVEILR